MKQSEIESDYRIQELLAAVNEGILHADFVRAKLAELAADSRLDLRSYSDGEYYVTSD